MRTLTDHERLRQREEVLHLRVGEHPSVHSGELHGVDLCPIGFIHAVRVLKDILVVQGQSRLLAFGRLIVTGRLISGDCEAAQELQEGLALSGELRPHLAMRLAD